MKPSQAGSKDRNGVEATPTAFVEQFCVPYLCGTQNTDGGWGFSRGSGSRTEPSAWALLALNEFSSVGASGETLKRGYKFLESTQLPDGSWPAAAGQKQGCWITSLACWALLARDGRKSPSASRGLQWLINAFPGESRLLRRLIRAFTADPQVSAQNDSYYGWSWTNGTASWVEPTAYALIVLRSGADDSLSTKMNQRIERGEAMLYDRMCPGGGWNSGNPMVYGVAGEPQVGPTVWALLALRGNSQRPENAKGLDWLEKNWKRTRTPASLAMTYIALTVFHRATAEVEKLLHSYDDKEILWNTPAICWAVLAMSEKQHWLNPGAPIGKG